MVAAWTRHKHPLRVHGDDAVATDPFSRLYLLGLIHKLEDQV
jgi:hypothetical protein